MIYYHVHSMLSNATTIIDSTTKYDKYIEKAKEYGCKAFGFSEHGNLLEWYHKKQAIEKAGMKYIHGVEMYITKSLDEKVRDNYHVVLMARNFEGYKELNKLVSKGFNRAETKVIDDIERYYYNPRISYDELKNVSDNIIMTTACIGGILGRDNVIRQDFIEYMAKNKDRCFLEIQHHNTKSQSEYNKYIVKIHEQYSIPLIAGTDTHMLTDDEFRGRELLQIRKNIHFNNEEGWNLAMYDYATLINMYKTQDSISEEYYTQALNNTDLLYDMIDEYKIDTSHKYPRLSPNAYKDVISLCKEGIKNKKLEYTDELRERLNYEIKTYEHNDAFDFLLLDYEVKKWARENDVFYGESRGSVSGSMVAYLMDITKINSLKYNMNFERFMNIDRISLADVDTDWMPSRRDDVKEYLHKNPKYYTSEIVTFNTIAEKGSIRDIGGALDISLDIINDICKNLENDKIMSEYKRKYPDLFKYAKQVEGTITSIGSHPAATICSPIDLVENIGTITLPTNKYPISTLNMKEIDSLNFVKLDVLGLDNVEIIYKTCKLAGIEPLVSDKVDFEDEKIWQDMMKSPVGVFQFEGDFAHSYLKQVFSEKTMDNIKKFNPNINYLYLMSVANGAIRPAGQSYRDALSQGLLRDNGHKILNDFLKDTNGYLVFQEQIIEFLNQFCGYTMGEADLIRRGFAKKTGTDKYIPKIKSGFVKTMKEKYQVEEIESEKLITNFIQVIEDASDYLFSLNHSLPYSIIGYMCTWLRYYYPLEFIATILEMNADDKIKTASIYDYMSEFTNITVKPARFRYSSSNYSIDKKTNTIYKGIASIKDLKVDTGEQLYTLRNNKYNSFNDLLFDIKTKLEIGDSQLVLLTKLNFFEEFGKVKKLLSYIQYFGSLYKAKVVNIGKFDYKIESIINKYSRSTDKQFRDLDNDKILSEIWRLIPDEDIPIIDKITYEKEYLGYISYTNSKLDKRYIMVTNLETKYSPKFIGYCLNNGKTEEFKVYAKKKGRGMNDVVYFKDVPFKEGDVLFAKKFNSKPKSRKTEEGWKPIPNSKEWWLVDYTIVENNIN